MNQLKKTILLALLLPLVGAFLLYQIDPDLLDPSSDKSLFSFISMASDAADLTGQIDLTSGDSPSQLLGMIFTSFGSDSLKTSEGVRDPMKPLVSMRQVAVRPGPVRRTVVARFPLKVSDINAIFYRSNSPQVLIKGKRYRVGDEVVGAEITAINQSSVVFSWRNNVQ